MRDEVYSYPWLRGPDFLVEVRVRADLVRVVYLMGWPRSLLRSENSPRWYYDSLTADEWSTYMAGFLDRAKRMAEPAGGGEGLKDAEFKKKYPALYEAVTARGVYEGKDTNRFSLSVFVHDGVWKAILRDKADATALWIASDTFAGLSGVIEAALADPETIWRADRFQGAKEATRKRKGA